MAEDFIVLRRTIPTFPEFGPSMAPAGESGPSLSIGTESLDEQDRAELRRDPTVRAFARSMPMKLIEPTDFDDGPEVQPQAGSPTWGVQAVGAPQSPFDGQGISVAILDTGIDPDHEAFNGVDLVRRNFTQGSDNDDNGHGTHCAGTVFGRDVGGQRIGVAPGVERALIGKVLGPGGGSSKSLAEAINWAVENGAHVISMSLGIDFPTFVQELVDAGFDRLPATSIALEAYRANVNLFTTLAASVNSLGPFGQGTVIVAAAGNAAERPNFTIAVEPPAAGTGVLAVAALQEGAGGLSVARFSNNQVNLAGPGVGVVSARSGGGLRSLSGTSMATPHVAGVAALWAQRMRDAVGRVEADTILAQLVGTATTSSLAPGFLEDDVGTGLVQAPTA